MGHGVFELLIAAGDNDGIVDIRAHLDRADHEVAHEEERLVQHGGDREVDPDAALNDKDQQHRHSGGQEREQHHQHDENGHDAHDRVVAGKGLLEVVLVRGVARDVDVPVGVIALGERADGVDEGVGLIAAYREHEIAQHAAVVAPLQLRLGAAHLRLRVREHAHLLGIELDDARIRLLADEEEHVDERHLVRGDVSHELAVVALLGGIDDLRHLIVQPRKLRKLPRRQLVGEHAAVHRLGVGKADSVVDLPAALKLREQDGLFFIVREQLLDRVEARA